MVRRWGRLRYVQMLAAMLWAAFLGWLAIYPVPSAADADVWARCVVATVRARRA